MKNLVLLNSLFLLISCSGPDKKEIPQEKQITYSIDAAATIPVIIYFNDIKISDENTPLNESVDLNAYALKNGKYKVKIQILPVFRRGDTKVSPEDIKSCKFSLVSFVRNKENQDRL
ncbi:hypothetical protein IV494_00040 [Kaistella sp. G5-32]|uniref:Lipoprotein n=1 Tax=Kaistella gelatinilytica TaxID=2787636 RepID=A0ABS0F797_9FLAO|nr:hypothetical protein [Kaistella gelatinilytica]MBF8455557.1 hypothetical protein [Kaistella gelatinilytica]